MDIIFVSGTGFELSNISKPQMGQEILNRIVGKKYETMTINLDSIITNGKLAYNPDHDKMLDIITDYLASLNSRIVGFYTICSYFLNVVELTVRLKAKSPEVKILYGGPHATMLAEECLKAIPELDIVALGESEYSILPIVDAMLADGPYDDVRGIAFRKDGRTVVNPCYELIPDKELGNYTVYDLDGVYIDQFGETVDLEGGRGCPFNCSFCSTSIFWGRKHRVKPIDVLIGEMDRISEKYGVKQFSIRHDNFTVNRSHVVEFCSKLLELGRNYVWVCSSRADALDRELIELMARSGCNEVFLGVETGSARMQKIIHKNLNLPDVLNKVSILNQCGIDVTASLIYGLPDEKMEDFDDTLKLFGDLYLAGANTVQLHRFFPLPMTEEAAKIQDRMYFDENDIDRSIFKKEELTDEGRNWIEKYPSLFSQFYTFESETRMCCPWIEDMTLIVEACRYHFEGSLKYLMKKLGFKELYLKYENLAERIHKGNATSDFCEYLIPGDDWILKDIVEKEEDEVLSDLFRFESQWKSFKTGENRSSEVIKYSIDVIHAEKTGEIISGEYNVLFHVDKETGHPRARKVRGDIDPSLL